MSSRSLNILVVDDEEVIRNLFVRLFSKKPHKLLTSSDGYDALQLIQEQPVDIVFLDVQMPGINGFETFREIKALRPSLPVVLMTGYAEPEQLQQALDEGVVGILYKPLDLMTIYKIVERFSKKNDADPNTNDA